MRDRGMHKEGQRKGEVAREEVARCNHHIIDITSAIEAEKEQFTVKYPFPRAYLGIRLNIKNRWQPEVIRK
jgi:hypothetical protein